MSRPGTIGWFARHEARLAWRDWLSLMTAGRRRRVAMVVPGFILFAVFLHALAWLMLGSSANLTGMAGKDLLVTVTGTLVLSWSLMLSQALESVTRAFYARGDLELILTSPAAAARLFAVRIAAMAATIVAMALALGAPFIDVLAWRGGTRWLGGYVVAVALAMTSVAAAAALAIALFRAIGPRRTRVVAQVLAAVIGAGFAIGLQIAAILSYGALPGTASGRLAVLTRLAPDVGSALWLPARAVMGEPIALAAVAGFGVVALAAAIRFCAPRFGGFALSAANLSLPASGAPRGAERRSARFHGGSPMRVLRRKEWMLLLRDPWLLSQTLMQLLYLLPAAFILWRNFHGGGATALLVPILIVASGQLGGGLAWLAVSGEDAPELIASAPVSTGRVLRAKAEAVLGGIAMIFCPFVAVLGVVAPFAALVTLAGVIVAAGSSTAIQYWFRGQAKRSLFRRRQTSSRVATFAEALSSTFWAGTGALAASGSWLAVVPGVFVLMIVGGAWLVSPVRGASLT